jgi:hypothetical protein
LPPGLAEVVDGSVEDKAEVVEVGPDLQGGDCGIQRENVAALALLEGRKSLL